MPANTQTISAMPSAPPDWLSTLDGTRKMPDPSTVPMPMPIRSSVLSVRGSVLTGSGIWGDMYIMALGEVARVRQFSKLTILAAVMLAGATLLAGQAGQADNAYAPAIARLEKLIAHEMK